MIFITKKRESVKKSVEDPWDATDMNDDLESKHPD